MLEMLVVLVIVGILSAMAITGWHRLMWHAQALGAAHEFRDAILLARSDAITKKRHSGIYIDPAGLRYLRFIDADASDQPDGHYDSTDTVLQNWASFPSALIVRSPESNMSPDPRPRSCDASQAPLDSSAQVGFYSLVFKPDGRSWATFDVDLGVRSFPDDTFHIKVIPATGLVQLRMEK